MPEGDSSYLEGRMAQIESAVRELVERERQLATLDLPSDLGTSSTGHEIMGLEQRIATLEVGGEDDYSPKLLSMSGSAVTPAVLTPTPEGTETAATDTWDVDVPAEIVPATDPITYYDGVTIKLHTRTVYNDTGDKVLYGFYRLFTFDSAGLLKTISAETRYTIDTPGACP